MQKQLLVAFLCLFIIAGVGAQQKRNLVWSDEFNYKGLPDPKKWGYDTGGRGWGNNELQYYTFQNTKNARVENGHLIIEVHKEQMGNNNYNSARLVTKGKGDWTHGRIEVSAKLPKGLGTWPAIWMLGSKTPLKWPDDGEIDIMEHVGFDQGNIHASVHCKKYNHIIGTQKTDTIHIKDCSEAFHVYQLDWDAETIRIGIDNTVYFEYKNEHSDRTAWPFSEPMYLLLNVAVGGNWGGQKGVDSSIYPLRMEVDYVRVFQ
jgi:beta-glucanase (GH16 family)